MPALRPMAAPGWKLKSWEIGGQQVPQQSVDLPISQSGTVTVTFEKAMPEPPTSPVVELTGKTVPTQRADLTGVATPDSVVTVTNEQDDQLGTTTVVGDGQWRLRPAWNLAVGANKLTLTSPGTA